MASFNTFVTRHLRLTHLWRNTRSSLVLQKTQLVSNSFVPKAQDGYFFQHSILFRFKFLPKVLPNSPQSQFFLPKVLPNLWVYAAGWWDLLHRCVSQKVHCFGERIKGGAHWSILKQLHRLSDLFKLSDAASVFRCFPPSTLEADDGYSYNSTTLEEVTSSNSEKDSEFLEGVASSDLSDCAPQESPVAEAGPGVSYPGYKQYCRYEQRSLYPSSLFLIVFVFFSTGPDSSGCHGSADVSEGKSSRSILSSDQPKFFRST